MKKHSYAKLISMSWNRTLEILFRPFNLKKWIMLAIIVILAGQMGGGFNFSTKGSKEDFNKFFEAFSRKSAPAEMQAPSELPGLSGESTQDIAPQNLQAEPYTETKTPPFLKDRKTMIVMAFFVLALLLFIGVFTLLWIWITSNFSFVLIDSIIRNDASLRIPFHRNKVQGNSYYRWNIVFVSIASLVFGAIISLPIIELAREGAFSAKPPLDIGMILSVILRYVPLMIISGIMFFIVAFLTREFILPIMYKGKIGILKAWGVFAGLFRKNFPELLLFLLVRIGLGILALAISLVLAMIGLIALLLIGALVFLLGLLIFSATPTVAKPVITVVMAIIALPLFMFLGLLFNLLFLPIPVFFRTFSIYVLGSMDESLDLFAPKTQEELLAEADMEKYRKSMAIVWFTVLSPIVFAILGIIAAIAAQNFVSAREGAAGGKEFDIKSMTKSGKLPAMPTLSDIQLPAKKAGGETVDVRLKNGNSFEAEIEKETEQTITFRIEGGTFTLHRDDILSVDSSQEEGGKE